MKKILLSTILSSLLLAGGLQAKETASKNASVKEVNKVSVSNAKSDAKEEDYYRVESVYGKFSRSFTLPEKIDVENIHAESSDGVLEVIIPKLKVEDTKPKKIEIKSGGYHGSCKYS